MKKISKLSVALVLVFSMLIGMVGPFAATAAENEDLGGYYVLAMDSQQNYDANIGSFPNRDSCYAQKGFEASSGASYFSVTAPANGMRKLYISDSFKNGYKYGKIVWMVSAANDYDPSKNVGFYVYNSNYSSYKSITTTNHTLDGNWRTSTFCFNEDTNTYNIIDMECNGTTSGWGHLYVKYIAFFETEAGMNAYDRKILSATVDGNAAEVDEFNKTITYNVPYGKEYDESAEHSIEVTPVFGATATKTDSGYDVTYNGTTTSYTLAINYAEVTSPYIYSFETQDQYNKNSSLIKTGNAYPSTVAYNETAGAAELVSPQWKTSFEYGITVNNGPKLADYDYVKIRYRISKCYNPDSAPTNIYAGVYVDKSSWPAYSATALTAAPTTSSAQWSDIIVQIPSKNSGNDVSNYNIKEIYLNYIYNYSGWTNLQIKYVGLFDSYAAAAKFDYNADLIKEFRIGENVGTVNDAEKTIECYAPKGDVSQLNPTVTFKKGAKAVSGKIESDGTSNVFKVKRSDGTVVTYTVVLKSSIDNLAVKGDAEGESPIGSDGWMPASKMTVVTEGSNHYILYKTTGNNDPLWYGLTLQKGHKYLLMFDAKSNVEQIAWISNTKTDIYMDSVWRTYSLVYTPSEDDGGLTVYAKANGGCEISLDNLKIYDVTNLAEAEFSIPNQFTAESATGIINKNMVYDIPGSTLNIKQTVEIPSGRYAAAEGLTRTAEGFSAVLNGKGARINVELKDNMDWSTAADGSASLTAADSNANAILYKAVFSNGVLSSIDFDNISLASPVTVAAATGKELFVWESNDTLKPLTESYKVMPNATVYVCSDKGGAVWNDYRNIQGWGYYLPELADGNATIMNMASDSQCQTAKDFVASSGYTAGVAANLKSGDWMIISFGRSDAVKSSVDEYKTAVRTMISDAKAKGANAVIVADMGMTNDFVSAAANIAIDNGVPFINMSDKPDAKFFSDDTNLNYAGARYAADMLAEIIKNSDCDLRYYFK